MDFNNFRTYSDSFQNAFETFCTQLFERYLRRKYGSTLVKFRVVNGAGGDGGIEAYGELSSGELIAVQAKWFRTAMQKAQISQIEKSITTAMRLRKISEYIICVPRSLSSIKMGKGKVPITDSEESRADQLTDTVQKTYNGTTFTWWFEQDMQNQLLEPDNEGMHKFWFERVVITHRQLTDQFDLQKAAWIDKRYIPKLHGIGMIQGHLEQILFSQSYRTSLLGKITETANSLQTGSTLIARFCDTLVEGDLMLEELQNIRSIIEQNLSSLSSIITAIADGISELPPVTVSPVQVSREILTYLTDLRGSDRQLGLPKRLSESLRRISDIDVEAFISRIRKEAMETGRLFLGNPGTGKTHALANTVDVRLNTSKLPALIIRAKGAPCDDWTSLLQKAVDIDNWNKNEILSALESLAVRADHEASKVLNPGDELKHETTKVMICVDGLEEDTERWEDWYARIRQSVTLMNRYPRVRFAFTARPYFHDEAELPANPAFRVVDVPLEGDVPVQMLIDDYFREFDVKVEPKSLIRGIDSLFALRLFCQLYKWRELTAEDEILTAEHDLLSEKVKQMEQEFRKISRLSGSTTPVLDGIEVVSKIFYAEPVISYEDLYKMMKNGTLGYLDASNVENLIEFLTNNAILIKSEILVKTGALMKPKISYTITYQSIMELMMADKYVEDIQDGKSIKLPDQLIAVPHTEKHADQHLVNQRIVQQVVNKLYYSTGQLIGEGFLTEGLSPAKVMELQTTALIYAPAETAAAYRESVDRQFLGSPESRYFVFKTLIYPSAKSSANYFGAEYLHDLLISQPTAVARDKIWMGLDRHDIYVLDKDGDHRYFRYDLRRIIDPYGEGDLYLPELSLYNEYPLVFGWALSTLDQSFRERLRTALTGWAIKNPFEFKLLLDKLFKCNDPQIQEDLASISLGVASKLKDGAALQQLAEWTLSIVFPYPGASPDIVVRTGFRAIVEKAFYAGVIDDKLAKRARPAQVAPQSFIPLDADALDKGGEQIYPVVHDLAWYVIKRSFDDFLDYQFVEREKLPEDAGEEFLKAYLEHFNLEHLSAYSWAISAAIAYIKELGFNRRNEIEGNGYTDASHGSKSKLFTQEEKYTWLAVHYIQGYLSDYLPLKETGEFVSDYMKIINVDNPAELMIEIFDEGALEIEDNWIIKESLAPEMSQYGTADEKIKEAVEGEPEVDFNNWINFRDSDLKAYGSEREWLALFNYTRVHDSEEYITASIDIRGVLIEKGGAAPLLDLVANHYDSSWFVESIDRMVSSPDTDTYSNPTDLVWMRWIGEIYDSEQYYLPNSSEEKNMYYAVASVTKNTVENGEEEIYIPSKRVREMLNISEMVRTTFLDDSGQSLAINHIIKHPNYDRQEMTLVDKEKFLAALEKSNLEIVWFVDYFRSKNALNDHIKSNQHPMKTRKYMVWYENGELKWQKFWDERASNQRDRREIPSDHDED
jgi:hypothetical protein